MAEIHQLISINSACFQGAAWRELGNLWHALGARHVSVVGTLRDSDPEAASSVLRDGFTLETIVHPFMFGHQLDAGDAVIAAEQERLSVAIDVTASLGGRSMFMATGGRGGLTWEEAADVFCAAIAPCAAKAQAAGILLMVENTPPLYADLSITHSLRDTLTLAEHAGIGVCMDVFSCWTEAGLAQTIERAMSRCHLIQLADYCYGDRALPARAVPGDGVISIRRLCGMALSAGYGGVFELELMGPRIDAEGHLAATRRAAENVGEILSSLGV